MIAPVIVCWLGQGKGDWGQGSTLYLPVLVLHYESLCLSLAFGKTLVSHLCTLFDVPVQQEALVSLEQLQLVSILQLFLPKRTSVP